MRAAEHAPHTAKHNSTIIVCSTTAACCCLCRVFTVCFAFLPFFSTIAQPAAPGVAAVSRVHSHISPRYPPCLDFYVAQEASNGQIHIIPSADLLPYIVVSKDTKKTTNNCKHTQQQQQHQQAIKLNKPDQDEAVTPESRHGKPEGRQLPRLGCGAHLVTHIDVSRCIHPTASCTGAGNDIIICLGFSDTRV